MEILSTQLTTSTISHCNLSRALSTFDKVSLILLISELVEGRLDGPWPEQGGVALRHGAWVQGCDGAAGKWQ